MVFAGVRCLAAVALLAVTTALLALSGPADASSSPAPSLGLVSQSTAVTPLAPEQAAPFQITLRVTGAPPGAEIGLVFYDKLANRSDFQATLTGRPSGVMQEVAPQPLGALHPVGAGLQITTTVVAGTAEPAGSSTVGLGGHGGCVAGNGSCSGVYPVEVELLGSTGANLAHFTTYLVYSETRSAHPLVFSWVVPISAPVDVRAGTTLPGAIPPLGAERVRHLAVLAQTLAANPSVQATVVPSLATLQQLEADPSPEARLTLAELRQVAADGGGRLIAESYVPVNLASLSEAGVTVEIAGQTQPANSILAPVTAGLPAADQPSHAVWVTDGPVSPAIAKGLAQVRAHQLVLPDGDLASASAELHASWSQPFDLDLGRSTLKSAAADDALGAHFGAAARDPVLAANQLLAELAMIQSELPNPTDARGVIAMTPASWDPNPQFVATLVSGLTDNPVVSTATLNDFFGTVPVGGNQAQTTRHLASGSNPERIGANEAAEIVRARSQIDDLSHSMLGASSGVNQLEDVLLSAESSELRPKAQLAALSTFEHLLSSELSSIKVVTSGVTLTARTATIPITIVSDADLHLTAQLNLSSPKLVFPKGATRTVRVDHPTNLVQIQVQARTTGDLPLAFTLSSPGGALIIAHGRLTVRSTATSLAGIVLTLAAAVVLVGWWARTWLQGRRRKRSSRSAST